jgi:hypothetical protein
MTTSGPESPTPDPDADEVARLKEEVARLKELQASTTSPDRQGWWRPVVAGLLVAIAVLLAPMSVLATWASGQIQDTDRYLETVAPLANDPDVQAAIVVRVEQVIYSYLDLDAALDEVVGALQDQGLPERAATTLSALAGPLATGIRSFIHERIVALVASDAFETAWVEANRTAHSELVAALTGEGGGSVEIDNGTVSVNLAVLINTLKQQLIDAGFAIAERIPEVAASFTIVQSDDLATVQNLLGLLDNLSTWLPVVGLGLLAAAVAISRDRRRWVLVSGLAMAGSMLLLGAVLNAIRPIYLDALPDSSSPQAAGAIYDQLVSFIRMALRGVAIVGLTVAVVAWFSASRGAGAAARRGLVGGIDGVRRGTTRAGLNTGKFGLALGQYRGPIRVAVVGIAAAGYLAQDHPTGGTALAFVLGTALVLLVLAILAADPENEADQSVPALPGGTV